MREFAAAVTDTERRWIAQHGLDRYILGWVITVLLGFACGLYSASAWSQTTQYYGAQGQWLGSSSTIGNTTQYYSPQGYQGMASRVGPTTNYYGPSGWLGMATGTPYQPIVPVPMTPWMPAPPTWGR